MENRLKISNFKTKTEVVQLFKNCRAKYINQQVKAFYLKKEHDLFCLIISVDRKFGNAVKRNLLKRRIKNAMHILHKSKSEKFKGINLLIKVKGTYDANFFTFTKIKKEFESFFETI